MFAKKKMRREWKKDGHPFVSIVTSKWIGYTVNARCNNINHEAAYGLAAETFRYLIILLAASNEYRGNVDKNALLSH